MVAKSDRNSGKRWTREEVSKLRGLARGNTPSRIISLKLGRPLGSVYQKASEKGISLKPTNQSPDDRRRR